MTNVNQEQEARSEPTADTATPALWAHYYPADSPCTDYRVHWDGHYTAPCPCGRDVTWSAYAIKRVGPCPCDDHA